MTEDHKDWISRFQGLANLSPETRRLLSQNSQVLNAPAGTQVFAPGQPANNLWLMLDGVVRVQQRSDTGREVILYRVRTGESCVLTTACMLAFEDYSAEGIAETDATAVAIPRDIFDELTATSRAFREFIFRAYSERITQLFTLIDSIIFHPVDMRLASRLLELADENGTVHITHQVLANELGTAREVVSRTLSSFQRRGWIEQARGAIHLTGQEHLVHLVRSAREG